MSVNSTPRGMSAESIPLINPNEYFNAEKVQSTIPCIFIKKLGEIVDDYFKLKPEIINKENQIKGLYAYNQKMMETIETFMHHEKKVVRKYNKLCQIYAKNFKEYWNAKNIDVNFKDMMNPITSISETFSMNEWKIEIQQNPPLVITLKYEEMLLNVIKKYYLNQNNELQSFLQKQLQRLLKENCSEPASLSHIRQQLMQLNTTPPTTGNMFDLLEKRKNIENLIKEIDQNYYSQFINKDLNFIDEVQRIHTIVNNPGPQTFRKYLDHEAQIRRNLRKKSKKFRENLEIQFERIEAENAELKQEMQQLRKKNIELEESRNDFRNKFQYLQIKQKAGTKKQKNSSNTSIIQDNMSIGLKQNTKKFEIKIGQLEAQIANLKQIIADKQQINKHLNVKRQLMNSNSEMEQLRLKLCSKLMELGVVDTEAMTSGEMFDKIMEKQLGVKHYEVKDPTGNKNNQYIYIKITQSVPMGESYKNSPNLQTPPQIGQSIVEKQPSLDQRQKQQASLKKKENILQFQGIQQIRQTQQNDIQFTNIESRDPTVYNPITRSEPLIANSEDEVKQIKNTSPRKNNYYSPIASEVLLSISQRKSIQQQSKMHEVSKLFRYNKSAFDEKPFIKGQQNSKYIQQYLTTIKKLEQKNLLLCGQQNDLKKQINRLQQLLSERKRKTPSVFESIENQLKNADKDHATQIQNVCQSILKQFQKLDGDQFTKMMSNMEELIKNFKSSSSIPYQNIKQIPVLSKHITQQQDNLIKSENLLAQLFLGKKQDDKRKFSMGGDKSGRLSLKSGEVKLQLKYEKSIYFGMKDQLPQSSDQFGYALRIIQQKVKNTSNQREQSSIQFDQDELIDNVKDFEGTSRKRKDPNNSENSLKFSQSNLKNSREQQIKSSLRIIDKIDRKIMQDAEFMQKIQQKLQQIKNDSESGHDLYWFYKRYRQAIQALQSTQAKLKQFQRKKDTCMNQIAEEDGNLSKHKLQEKIYFLQQKVNELEDRLISNKEQYEYNMTQNIKGIEEIKQNAIEQLIKGIFGQRYNMAN